MARILLLTILCMACSCVERGFERTERAIIGDHPGAGAMKVWMAGAKDEESLLRSVAAPLRKQEMESPYFDVLCARMLATVMDPANDGVGIAAPQVGVSRRLIAVQRVDKEGSPFEFYINPVIDSHSATMSQGPEGCLSITGRRGLVERYDTITIRYTDRTSRSRVVETVVGYTAVIFQHEIDHLDGILFTDKISNR